MRASAIRGGLVTAAVAVAGMFLVGCGGGGRGGARTAAEAGGGTPVAVGGGAESAAPAVVTKPSPRPAPPAETLRSAARVVRPEIAPLDGETVGVGQPIAVVFRGQKVNESLRAGIEGRLRVTTSPRVAGAWHWAEAKGDTRVHFRPETYWPTGTRVTLDARLADVKLAEGTAAAGDRLVGFTIGESMVNKVDLAAHTLTVVRDGEVLRTIPISAGEERFKTRDGIKTILAKEGTVLMDSRTIGIPRESPDGFYDRYRWSMRETISGEYIHAAPDNAESFGKENVSHGCVGMSDADAKWLYGLSRKGDVVEVVGGSGKPMDTFGNGYGDWNLSWESWLAGSALGVRLG